jgi:hypothetical protein
MSEKYVYISGMDEAHGPMPESEAWAMANDQNRLTLEINADKTDGVYTVAIVLDRLDYKPDLWRFTAEHPSEQCGVKEQ